VRASALLQTWFSFTLSDRAEKKHHDGTFVKWICAKGIWESADYAVDADLISSAKV
jgi:hypothetical protein